MISKAEMKTYFIRANCHALRNSFKHAFHEITYFKPTFCIHCTGLVSIHVTPFVVNRPLVKSAYQKYNFLISQPKHMLLVLKRTVSMRRFFGAPKTYAKNYRYEKIFTVLR